MTHPGDRYCRACGSELNTLGNCPHRCRFALDEPLPDMEPEEPTPRHLKLVEDDEDFERPLPE